MTKPYCFSPASLNFQAQAPTSPCGLQPLPQQSSSQPSPAWRWASTSGPTCGLMSQPIPIPGGCLVPPAALLLAGVVGQALATRPVLPQ